MAQKKCKNGSQNPRQKLRAGELNNGRRKTDMWFEQEGAELTESRGQPSTLSERVPGTDRLAAKRVT